MTGMRSLTRRAARLTASAIDRLVLKGADDRPVFVGGCPRSGTTLVRTMLHAHPDLALPRETLFLLEAYNRRREFGDLRVAANRRKLADWLIDDNDATRFKRLELEPDAARARLAAAPPTLGSVIGTAFKMYAEKHGAMRWGDKRPLYILNLPLIFGLFPDVQFINVVRDPRGVVASMRKLGWLEDWSDGTVVGGIDRWMRSVHAGHDASKRYRADQFTEVRYEALLDEPEKHLRRIIGFAGLSDEHLARVLEFHQLAGEIPDRQRNKYHPLLGQPLTTAAVRSWTTQLADEEVAFIEKVAATEMTHYGYEPTAKGVRIPADLERRWDEVLENNARRRRRRRRLGRTPSYPYAMAARLTDAQRRRARLLRLRGKR